MSTSTTPKSATTPMPAPQHRRWRATLFVLLAFVAALSLLGWVSAPEAASRPAGTSATVLAVATSTAVEETSYDSTRSFVGRVEAARESETGFELGGKLATVEADEGDVVRRGQILARLDTARLEARRAELQAAFEQARTRRELAGLTRQRVGEALALDAVSAQDWDDADQGFRARQAGVRQAESALEAVEVDLSKAVLRAPYDALVAERFVDEGEVLQVGAPVFKLLERTRPQARIGVAGDAVSLLAAGQEHPVEIGGERLIARVKAVLPVRGDQTRSVEAILTLPAPLDGLRVGDLATLRLDTRIEEPGFWLPLSALTESSRGLWATYVAEPLTEPAAQPPGGPEAGAATHRLVLRQVELLHPEAERVYVRGTLLHGDQVVRDGLQRLVPGLEVRLADEPEVLIDGEVG